MTDAAQGNFQTASTSFDKDTVWAAAESLLSNPNRANDGREINATTVASIRKNVVILCDAVEQGYAPAAIILDVFLREIIPHRIFTSERAPHQNTWNATDTSHDFILLQGAKLWLMPEEHNKEIWNIASQIYRTDLIENQAPAATLAEHIARSHIVRCEGKDHEWKMKEGTPPLLRYHVAALIGLDKKNLRTTHSDWALRQIGFLNDEIAESFTNLRRAFDEIKDASNGTFPSVVSEEKRLDPRAPFDQLEQERCPDDHIHLRDAAIAARDFLAGDVKHDPRLLRERVLGIVQETYFAGITMDTVRTAINDALSVLFPAPTPEEKSGLRP